MPERYVTIGSCFSDYVAARMAADGITVCANPCGTLFNPASMARTLSLALTQGAAHLQSPIPGEAFFLFESAVERGWRCWDFPTRFTGETLDACRLRCEEALETLRDALEDADTLVVTFGTAWVFELAAVPGRIVANCHKVPAREFVRRRLSVEEIVTLWLEIIKKLRAVNPELKIVFTVSPVRHLKDGLQGNACSKATLLLACERLAREPGCGYFPAYEIVIDELRDHSFFAADDVHPGPAAVEEVYRRFLGLEVRG